LVSLISDSICDTIWIGLIMRRICLVLILHARYPDRTTSEGFRIRTTGKDHQKTIPNTHDAGFRQRRPFSFFEVGQSWSVTNKSMPAFPSTKAFLYGRPRGGALCRHDFQPIILSFLCLSLSTYLWIRYSTMNLVPIKSCPKEQ
jgi:hypothetical protein